MLRRVLRSGARLALVVGFVSPPFLAYTWAVCPNTMRHLQLCPDKLGVDCPSSGGTQGCANYEWVLVKSGYFGCRSTKDPIQCLDDVSAAPCYDQGPCKEAAPGSNQCTEDEDAKQTFTKVKKSDEPCP